MKIHPIQNEADYDQALTDINRLWGAKPGTADGQRLDVLSVLVDDYESKHHPIAPPDPVDAIKFRMEQSGMTRSDLKPLIGPPERIDKIISRQRPLTLAMIRKLHFKLNIPLESLIQPPGV